MHELKTPRITLSYAALTAAVVLLTWVIHEAAHWAAGEALGNAMYMSLNASGPVSGTYHAATDETPVSAAGPLITLVQAVLAFALLRRGASLRWVPVLFVPVYMRALAAVLNVINKNDEGRISADLGLGTWTIPVLVTGFLVALAWVIIRRRALPTRFVVGTFLLIMLFASVIVLADMAWKPHLL
ncbi:MAG: hypothetical protein JWP27_2466 [Flaviaesturariibacter sp.]|nr:hypothetical protein [Flaviaesturariibacter sp.]